MGRELVLPANFAADFEPVLTQDDLGEFCETYPVTHYGRTFVTHSGIALRRFMALPETLFPRAPSKDRHLHRYALLKFFSGRRVRLRGDDLLLIHNHWSTGFYHWLAEALLKIQFVEPSQYRVIVPAGYPSFVSDSLKLFDWKDVAVLPAGRDLVADGLTIVSNPPADALNPAHIEWLRSTLVARCPNADGPPVRLYVSRRTAALRRVLNEQDVMSVLIEYGFEVVDTAELTFIEQVQLFSRCEAMVSPHGAGLTNLLFMDPGTAVLELYRELTAGLPLMNVDYWNLATAAGLRYHYQFCAHGPKLGPKIDDVDLTVDVGELRRNVELMLGG